MIELKNVTQEYRHGNETVRALHGISLHLRDRELAVVTGESGSGKITLFRLLAGLDSCTHGDVFLAGRSAGNFSSSERAVWRSAAVGLMTLQDDFLEGETVAANVDLPMSLAGMPRAVRRKRTLSLLKRIGLGERLRCFPKALTVYERRRLALARALANDPDIILAEDPFRGLSPEAVSALLDLFEAIARDRLVVLFCSSDPPLGERAVRRLHLRNGQLLSDSDPWREDDAEASPREWHRSLLGVRDSIRLSLHAAKGRKFPLFCAVLAVSISLSVLGLRLSLANSLQEAEREEQREALTLSPFILRREILDEDLLLKLMEEEKKSPEHGSDGVYAASYRPALLSAGEALGQETVLKPFTDAVESRTEFYSLLQKVREDELNLYASDTSLELRRLHNNASGTLWAELPGDGAILKDQYEIIAGRWCAAYDELMLFVDENNELSDVAMAALNLSGGESGRRNYEDLCSVTYRLLLPTDYYQRGADGLWAKIQDEALLRSAVNEGLMLHVVGIVKPAADSSVHAFPAVLGYPSSLVRYIAQAVNDSAVVTAQRENPELDIFTGLPFMPQEMRSYSVSDQANALRQMAAQGLDIPTQMAIYCRISGSSEADAAYKVSNNLLSAELSERLKTMGDGDCARLYSSFVLSGYSSADREGNLSLLGAAEAEAEELRLYCSSLSQREALSDFAKSWNARAVDEGRWTELVVLRDRADSLAAVSGRHSTLLLSLLTAFAAVALLCSLGLLAALLNAAVERQHSTLRLLYLLGISPADRGGLLRREGLLLGICCSLLGFGISIGVSALLPPLAQRVWNIHLLPGIPWLAALITLPGGMILGLCAALPACRRASALR